MVECVQRTAETFSGAEAGKGHRADEVGDKARESLTGLSKRYVIL